MASTRKSQTAPKTKPGPPPASGGARSGLAAAVQAIARPLAFAARDDFAHFERVRNLESALDSALQAALEFSLPSDLRSHFEGLRSDLSKELDPEGRLARARRLHAALAFSEREDWLEALLARPPSVLAGVGPKRAEALARRGIACVGDLLFWLPCAFEDRRSLAHVRDLEVGRRATFMAEVKLIDFVASRSRGRVGRILQAVVADETGSIVLKWFRASDTIARNIHKGDWLLITGDVKRYRFSKEIVHPETERIDGPGEARGADAPEMEPSDAERAKLRQVVPRYASPEGINPRALRRLIQHAVAEYADLVEGHLPPRLVAERRLPSCAEALRRLHEPGPEAEVESYARFASPAHQRLVLEELYLLELGLALRRARATRRPGIPIRPAEVRLEASERALPFELTAAQRRCWQEIRRDLAEPHPMNRLLQGDVGSGKTAVAYLAVTAVAAAGGQSALMAPTELLAEQHMRTLTALLAGGVDGAAAPPLRTALLTASVARSDAERIRRDLAAGEIDLLVGTHALVQPEVDFARLSLAVIDEQHRFGVRQRQALCEKGPDARVPHVLVMTATPIPRTLALTLYGDLDVSVIDELPPGRNPAATLLLREGEGRRITDMVRAAIDREEQVYVVYPLVEESEKVDLRSAIESYERIRAAFPDVGVELVHGRQSGEERDRAMRRFARGEARILVSTTVIEVGVDVPSATLMVIEHAERFGLAQLHQLRGRVGRGARPGTCVMVARSTSEKAEARLRAMLETHDGFVIADADLAIRGPGEFLGTRQSGHLPELRVADLLRDARLVGVARQAALETVRRDPELGLAPATARAVAARWGDRLALGEVA